MDSTTVYNWTCLIVCTHTKKRDSSCLMAIFSLSLVDSIKKIAIEEEEERNEVNKKKREKMENLHQQKFRSTQVIIVSI